MDVRLFTDQCHHSVLIPDRPKRIISLVPSQTELLFDLGLDDEVCGITRYCVHPTHWKVSKTIVGGTKDFNFEEIRRIEPDLIIGNKEENYKDGIETLQKFYPVWLSDIYNLDDSIEMIRTVGAITNRSHKSEQIISEISSAFSSVKKTKRLRVLYLIWRKPWMAAGSSTFIDHILSTVGLVNAAADFPRYPSLTPAQIVEAKPDFVLMSSEPFPFKEKHLHEMQALLPSAKILLVDGEMFSWYGSRLRYAPAYFNSLPLPRM